jgi:Zn-dependent peptidase ImmA (M78 family)
LGKPLRWRFEGFRVGALDTGAEVALEIRKLFKFGIYPVPSMVRVLEEFGVHIVQLETPARIDEFAGYIDGNPVVVVNPNLSNDRIRFNAGHALAHHLFRDCCRGGKGLSEEEVERRAHECASHLLIPEDQLANAFELKSMVRLVQYKERFGISLAAMIYRAKAAGLIPQDLYERLWREFSRLGWRVQEPGYVPPDRPVRMEALFDAAVCQKKMTYTRIAQLAGVDELTVKSRVLRAMGGSVSLVDRVEKGNVICLDEYRQELADKEGEP